MVLLKAVTVIVAGIVSIVAIRYVMQQMEAARVRVKAERPRHPRQMARLRQDPETGIYYPER